MILLLMEYGLELVNSSNPQGQNILHLFSKYDQFPDDSRTVEVVEFLLDFIGVPLDEVYNNGFSPLHYMLLLLIR